MITNYNICKALLLNIHITQKKNYETYRVVTKKIQKINF